MNRKLELPFYVTVGAGMALGTSVFTMIAGLFELASFPWILIGLILAGLCCIGIAMSVAELASMYRSAPGIRTYLKAAFGNRVSLMLVYMYLTFVVLIAGVESYMLALVATAVFPGVDPLWTVLATMVVVVGVNVSGFELPRSMQMLTTTVLLVGILSMGIAGVVGADWELAQTRLGEPATPLERLGLLPALCGMAIFMYMGFEWVTPLGLRPKSYDREIPISMPISIFLLMASYTCFVLAMGLRLDRAAIAIDSIPHVAYLVDVFGPLGVYAAGGLSILAIFSTFNAGVLGGSRLVFAISREGNLPEFVGYASARTSAPVGAICTLATLALACALAVLHWQLELIAAIVGASIICAVYAAFVFACLRLRKTMPEKRRPFQNRIPVPIQWALGVFLGMMALLTLFGEPEHVTPLLVGIGATIVTAGALTSYSVRRTHDDPHSLRD